MRIKTQAILITEDTYPIAVACLPAGFSSYPFGNVKGYWLVINVPGGQDRNAYEGDNLSTVGLHNEWIHPKLFIDKYEVINKKPGRKPENEYWVECELATNADLKERLETDADETFEKNTISRENTYSTRTKRMSYRPPVVGYHRGV